MADIRQKYFIYINGNYEATIEDCASAAQAIGRFVAMVFLEPGDRVTAEVLDADDTGELPQFYQCGCCEAYHRADFRGDCRQDDARFFADELDKKYGMDGWEEVYPDDDETVPSGDDQGELPERFPFEDQ